MARIWGKLPLPLGEGRGEGIATKSKTLLSPFLIGADKKEDGGSFLFLLLSYTLTPTLSQWEREFIYKILARWIGNKSLFSSPYPKR